MDDEEVSFKDAWEKVQKENQDFKEHPEKYPYYVIGLVKYPSKNPHKYGITNIPHHWDASLFEQNHLIIVQVNEGEDVTEVRKLAQEIATFLNVKEGKSPVDYEP